MTQPQMTEEEALDKHSFAVASYHPSFRPFLDRIQERGMYSPHAYVTYQFETHGHTVMLGDGQDYNVLADGGGIEEAGEELVEAVARCNPDQHSGHGRTHGEEHFEWTFKAAVRQLATIEYDKQHVHARWLEKMYKIWGGHIPSVVIIPNENDMREWNVLIPDHLGGANIYPANTSALKDVIPSPGDVEGIKKAEFGWKTPPRRSLRRRLKRLRKPGG